MSDPKELARLAAERRWEEHTDARAAFEAMRTNVNVAVALLHVDPNSIDTGMFRASMLEIAAAAMGAAGVAPEKADTTPDQPEPEGFDQLLLELERDVRAEVPGAKGSLARMRRVKRDHFSCGVDFTIEGNRLKAEQDRGIFTATDDAPATPRADAALFKKHSTLGVDFSACTNADQALALLEAKKKKSG